MSASLLLSREERILFLAAGPAGNDAALDSLLGPEVDWAALFALALHEDAAPVLWERVNRVGKADQIPEPVAKQLANFARVTGFRLLRLEDRLRDSVATLRRGGVPVMLLKGAALGLTVYGALHRRPMLDLDLLVRPEHVPDALRLLGEAGWSPDPDAEPAPAGYWAQHHFPALLDRSGSGFLLELHTDLFPPRHGLGLVPEMLWRDARPAPIKGAWIAANAHQLVHLGLHFAWSHGMGPRSWKTFRDVGTIVGAAPPDWAVLVERAKEARAESSCYWTFRLARALSGVPIPGEVLRSLRPPGGTFLHQRLERHFAGMLLKREIVCPSVQLQHWLWTLGIRPGRSGHGSGRPWDANRFISKDGTRRLSDPSVGTRVVGHLGRWRSWTRYLRAMASPLPGRSGG